MTPICHREGCEKIVHPDDANVLVQYSFTTDHSFWCSLKCYQADKNK